MRLLILAFLFYLLYRLLRGWIAPRQKFQKNNSSGAIDEMVQDPFCKTYVPKREAKRKVIKGKEYPFCSEECAERFEKELS